jgi:chaperonin cofactor prefoldin
MTLEEENARLKAKNAVLREQMTALLERVQDLQARLANPFASRGPS